MLVVPRRARFAGAGAEGEGVPEARAVSPSEGGGLGADAVRRSRARESCTAPVPVRLVYSACGCTGSWHVGRDEFCVEDRWVYGPGVKPAKRGRGWATTALGGSQNRQQCTQQKQAALLEVTAVVDVRP